MKKFFLVFMLCGIIFPLYGKMSVTVTAEPSDVVAGGEVLVKIEVDKVGNVELNLPEVANGQWLENSRRSALFQRHQIINGKVENSISNSVSLLLANRGSGEKMIIPPFEVKCGGESAKSEKLIIPVVNAAAAAKIAEESGKSGVGKIIISGGMEHYVGEKIDFELSLPLSDRLKVVQMEEPHFNGLSEAVFARRKNNFGQESAFSPLRHTARGGNVIYRLGGSFTLWKAGEYDLSATQNINVEKSDRNDWFSFPKIETMRVLYTTGGSALKILPLPEVPADVYSLGIVGKWQINAEIVPETLYVGNSAKLIVSGSGNGNTDNLTIPEIKIDNFRCYPAEVKKSADSFQLTYPLVAIKPGRSGNKVRFAVFNAEQKRYLIAEVAVPEVLGGVVAPTGKTASKEADVAPVEAAKSLPQKVDKVDDFGSLRSDDGALVYFPLWKNCRTAVIVILVLSFICAVILSTVAYRQKNLAVREAKKRFAKEKSGLLKMVSANKIDAAELLLKLACCLKLQSGSTADEMISASCDNAHIRELVKKCEEAEFSPGGGTVELNEELRRGIVDFVKKLSFVLLIGVLTFSASAMNGEAEFASGDYRAAAEKFRLESSRGNSVNLNALYNLGCAEYKSGNLPAAKSAFRRALLLSPGDREIAEKLNLINVAMHQNQVGEANSLADTVKLWRDYIRPDIYILLASIGAAFLLILLGAWPFVGKVKLIIFGCFLILWIGSCCYAVRIQMQNTYDIRQATAVVPEVRIHTLPQENSPVDATIPGGSDVKVLDFSLAPWLLVECNGRKGWVHQKNIEMLLPGAVW